MSQRERPAPRGSPATGIAASSAEPLPRLLDRLLAGDGIDNLAALDLHDFIDDLPDDLEPLARSAVSLALRTPDIALVRVRSSADGLRIADAVIAAAGRRGEQVHRIGPQPGVCRCREAVSEVYDQLGDLAWQHDELTERRPVARSSGLLARVARTFFGRSTGETESAAQTAVLEREKAVIADKWQQAIRRLPADGPPPDAMTVPAVAAARDAWRTLRNGAGCGPADLLVVTEAHALADLPAAVGGARRAVFIGEPAIGPCEHLWELLHADAWRRERGKIVCRLRPVSGRLDAEPVADRPDVELRIHTPPDGEPEVAEVAFPADTPIAAAVEWVFRELGELPGNPAVNAQRSAVGNDVAELGDGIRAVIASTAGGWDVPLIEFAGWDPDRADEWLRRHVVRAGAGRTVDITG
jgi:hypothetical protein